MPPPPAEDGEELPEDVDLRVPATATAEEAAAIAAAVGAYLADERAAAEAAGGRPWAGRRWALAGRLERLTGQPHRVPRGAPTGGWRAAARADRF